MGLINDIKNTDQMLVGEHRYRVRLERSMNLQHAIGSVKQLQGKVDFELSEVGELFPKLDPETVKFLQYFTDNIKKRFASTLSSLEKERQDTLTDMDTYKEFT